MEIDQVYRAPSIPKLSRRNIKSTLISGAIKPGVELKKTKFSFIKPLAKLIPESLIPDKTDENKKEGLIKYIESNFGIQKILEQSNKLLSQIREQLSLDFLSRINEEKKDLEEAKKRIAAEKVKDKEKKIESGGKGLLGKTFSAILSPAKSILQKLIDFFSIIFTGILVNTAFKWLQKPENQEKLKQFFQFLKDYWKELLIVFGAIKLLGLVRKILKVANALKGLIDFFRKKPQLPCNCPKSPAQNVDPCEPIKDCVDNLVKDPKKGPGFLEDLAQSLLGTKAFAPFLLLIKKPTQTPQPKAQQPVQQPGQQPTPFIPISPEPPAPPPPPPPTAPPTAQPPANKAVPFTRSTPSKPISANSYRSGIPTGTTSGGLLTILGGFALAKVEQERVKNKISQLQQLKTSNSKEYKKQLNELRNQAKFEKYINIVNEITGSPSIPTAYILKALGELKQEEIPKSLLDLGLDPGNPNRLTPDLNKDGSPLNTQSNTSKPSKKDIETTVRNNNPTFNQEQVTNITENALKLISAGMAVSEAIIQSTLAISTVERRSKGGTIPSLFAGGGTVGGPGSLGIDSVPAMIASGAKQLGNYGKALLAPGEEVIPTRPSMLFRPLLKDISENAGRLWQSFANAVRKQDTVNAMKSEIIFEFNKVLQEFKDLLDKESTNIKRKGKLKNKDGGGGGTLNPRRIPPSSTSSPVQTSSQNVQPMKMPKIDMSVDSSKIASQPQQKITPPQITTIEPKVTISNPIDITQKIIERPVKVPFMEKTFVDNTKLYVIPVKETIGSASKYQVSRQKPSINHITLPTKTINLGSTGPKSLPPTSSGTSVPSISPIDESNDYVFMTPPMYGIVVV